MKYLSLVTVILAATAAAFTQLPYPWAHTVALAITAGIAGIHVPASAPDIPVFPVGPPKERS